MIQGSALAVGIGTLLSVFYASAIDRIIVFSTSNIASINPSTLAITTNNPGNTTLRIGAYSTTSNLLLGAADTSDGSPRFWNCSDLTTPGTLVSAGRISGVTWASASDEFLVSRGGTNSISVINPSTRATIATIDNTFEPSGLVYCGSALNRFYVSAAGSNAGRFYDVATRTFLSVLTGDGAFTFNQLVFDSSTGLILVVSQTNTNTLIDPESYRTLSTFTTVSQTPNQAAAGLGVFMVAQASTLCRHFRASYSYKSGRIEEDLFTLNFSPATITVLRSEPFFSFCTALDAFPYQGRSILFETISPTDANVNANMILTGTTDIPVDGTLTFVGARTLTLGTKTSYTLRASIPATGVVEVKNNVSLLNFTFASGATINKASGVGGTITVTVASTTGITAGSGVTLVTSQPILTITGFPNASTVVISQAGIQRDLVNNQNSPYTYQTISGQANSYTIKVVAAGFEDFIVELNKTVSVSAVWVGIPLDSTDKVNTPYGNFFELMAANAAFIRVINGDRTLTKQLWTVANWQTEWNAAVVPGAPTSGEIAVWTGYLATTGYSAISFNATTGRVG